MLGLSLVGIRFEVDTRVLEELAQDRLSSSGGGRVAVPPRDVLKPVVQEEVGEEPCVVVSKERVSRAHSLIVSDGLDDPQRARSAGPHEAMGEISPPRPFSSR